MQESSIFSLLLGACAATPTAVVLENALTRVARELRQQQEATVRIEGHLRQARAAQQFLVAKGVTHCRLQRSQR